MASPIDPVTGGDSSAANEDLRAIADVLQAYRRAFQLRSTSRVRALIPSLTPEQLEAVDAAMREASSYQVDFIMPTLSLEGDRARVNAAIRETIVPINGDTRVITGQVTITLLKRNDEWILTSIARSR